MFLCVNDDLVDVGAESPALRTVHSSRAGLASYTLYYGVVNE